MQSCRLTHLSLLAGVVHTYFTNELHSVSGDDTPCPGPWTFSGLKYGNAFNENALICWVDSPPTISFQNQGQDPVIGVWPTDNTETASVPDDGYYNFDDENGENS